MSNLCLTDTCNDAENEGLRETLCALGNGDRVTRAAAPDAVTCDVQCRGTYLAGATTACAPTSPGTGPRTRIWSTVGSEGECRDPRAALPRQRGAPDAMGRTADRVDAPPSPRGTFRDPDGSGALSLRSGIDGTVTNWGVARYRELEGRHLETLQTSREDGGVDAASSYFSPAADRVGSFGGEVHRHAAMRLARRSLSRPHLVGRTLHLSLPDAADAGADTCAPSLPLPTAGPGAAGHARRRLRGGDVPLRQQAHLNPRSGRWIHDNFRRQRHIGSVIAYNVWEYVQATDDCDFMRDYAAEFFCEIARFSANMAEERLDGRYGISLPLRNSRPRTGVARPPHPRYECRFRPSPS